MKTLFVVLFTVLTSAPVLASQLSIKENQIIAAVRDDLKDASLSISAQTDLSSLGYDSMALDALIWRNPAVFGTPHWQVLMNINQRCLSVNYQIACVAEAVVAQP